MSENCEKKNGIRKISIRHWLWIIGIVFAAGGVVAMARSTATELPTVRAAVADNRADIAENTKELGIAKVRIGHNEEAIRSFRTAQETQTGLLRTIVGRLPAVPRRRRADGSN